jgi:hypothetical protein
MSEASSGAKSNKNPDPHHHRCFNSELKTYELTTQNLRTKNQKQ